MRIKNKRSQITLFVILAIAIVAVVLVLFLPRIQEAIAGPIPQVEIDNCLIEPVKEGLALALPHGGSINPSAFILYNNERIEYLCYSSDWYQRCVMQNPLLLQSIESEVESYAQEKVNECLDNAKEDLERRGYNVQINGNKTLDVKIIPDSVSAKLNAEIVIKKGDETTPLNIISSTDFNSGSYDMIMIASSILNFEAHYGDSTPEIYMSFYPDLKVEKIKQSDGSTVYIITHRKTGEKMRFASRSNAWPPGYAYQA